MAESIRRQGRADHRRRVRYRARDDRGADRGGCDRRPGRPRRDGADRDLRAARRRRDPAGRRPARCDKLRVHGARRAREGGADRHPALQRRHLHRRRPHRDRHRQHRPYAEPQRQRGDEERPRRHPPHDRARQPATSSSPARSPVMPPSRGSRSTRARNGRSPASSRPCDGSSTRRASASARSRPVPSISALLADWPEENLRKAKESGSLIEPTEVADAVMFMLTRPRNVTIRDIIVLPTNFDI